MITREEQYLNRLAGETEQAIPEPETRKEQYLSRLCGADHIIPQEPITREEQYLASLCGEEVEMPEPETRLEQYMAFAGGERENKPEPVTRKEQLWDKYQGGGVIEDKTVTGTTIHVTDAIAEPASKLEVAMVPKQEHEPWIDSEPDTEPYILRIIPRGNRSSREFHGGTIAWNQLVDSNTTAVPTIANRKYLTVINGTQTIINGDGTSISVTGGIDNVCDLTLMFANNPAIADYAYSLEQATAGAGVAWLKNHGFIDDEYHGYDPGSLKSVNISALKIIDTDLTEHTYPLTSTDLRGLFNLDAQNNLYTNGDVYTSDGTITRKYMFASFTISEATLVATLDNTERYAMEFAGALAGTSSNNNNSRCILSSGVWLSYAYNTSDTAHYYFSNTTIVFFVPKGTPTSTTVYVLGTLVTPTTETALTYDNPQVIEAGGIEEFVDSRDVKVPVGNSTIYSAEYEIEGYDNITVYHAQTQDEPNPTEYDISFTQQGIVYGGIIDITTGALSITWGYIASYNGETLPGEWLSSKDVYSEGTTPSTGAAVAFELASPQTYTLTAQEVQMLVGENTLWTQEEHELTLTYKSRAAQRVLAMNNKLNLNKQALELKRNGGVIIDKPIIKPIGGGAKL